MTKGTATGRSSILIHTDHRLLECYERGTKLAKIDGDRDYAHEMFAQCVVAAPSNLLFAEALLHNLRAHKSRPRLRWRRLADWQLKRALAHAVRRAHWIDVLRVGIDLLRMDPWDTSVLTAMAQACAALRYNEVELAYLKQALDASPNDPEVNRHCARSLARMGQVDQAIACWHRVEKNRKNDAEAVKMISQLCEQRLCQPAKRSTSAAEAKLTAAGNAGQRLEVMCDTAAFHQLELSRRQELEKAIAVDPLNPSNYLEFAELLFEQQGVNSAEELLSRAAAQCGPLPAFEEAMLRIRRRHSELEIAQAKSTRSASVRMQGWRFQMPWLEVLLLVAVCTIAYQLSPTVAEAVSNALDMRSWSRSTWLIVNGVILLFLGSLRFGPEFLQYWRSS